MSARSVHEAAMKAGAAGLCVRDGEGCPAHHLCEAEARRVIAALVASAEVREGLAGALAAHLAERIRWHPPYGSTSEEQWEIDTEKQFVRELSDGELLGAVLAALGGTEAT